MKVNTLHKLLEEYGNQIQWVKDLDFKIIYYTLGLFVAVIAWFSTNPPQKELFPFLKSVIYFLGIWSIVFLIRNHFRHSKILDKLHNIHEALLLNKPGEYYSSAIESSTSIKDLSFHMGRILYIFGIIIACLLCIAYIKSLISWE
jgi:hypothetical protein